MKTIKSLAIILVLLSSSGLSAQNNAYASFTEFWSIKKTENIDLKGEREMELIFDYSNPDDLKFEIFFSSEIEEGDLLDDHQILGNAESIDLILLNQKQNIEIAEITIRKAEQIQTRQTPSNNNNSSSSTNHNSDGTTSSTFNNGNTSTTHHSDGTTSTTFHNGNTSTTHNSDGTTSTTFHNENSSTTHNSNGSVSTYQHTPPSNTPQPSYQYSYETLEIERSANSIEIQLSKEDIQTILNSKSLSFKIKMSKQNLLVKLKNSHVKKIKRLIKKMK